MRRIIGTLALGGALLMATAPAVAANGDPTCSNYFGGYPHGYHVVADYVTGIGSPLLGGPGIAWPPSGLNARGGAFNPGGPNHDGVPPGASFCNDQAKSGER